MRKNFFKMFSVAVVATMSLVFCSCTKDKDQNEILSNNKNHTIGGSDVAMEITTTCAGVYDRYHYVTPEDGEPYWRWKRYEDDEFVFDIDVDWELPEVSGVEITSDNSFKVFYADGTDVQVSNVSSDGSFTTTQILADNDAVMTVNFTLPFDLDMMEVVSYFALYGADGPGDNYTQAIPWAVVYGAVLLAICIYDGVQSYKCEQGMSNAAEKCDNAGCKAKKGNCSVECKRTKNTPAEVNCSDYHYFG
ncbi:MAG: hypothetical protein J5605_02555 [Bacteroidales bacterium]|nr:hypothetical protein [Bacteroidales bacterium]